MTAARLATEARTAAFRSGEHHSLSEGRDVLPWPDVGDDDAATIELEALKDERRISGVREASRLLLADLKKFEAYPDEMERPDVDRKHVPLSLISKGMQP
jgi:hypothetical protein